MKKLVLSMAVVAAATMVSCGNKAENAAAGAADSSATVVEGVVVEEVEVSDTEAPSVLANIKSAATAENVQKGLAYVQSLVQSGKLAEARTYLDQIKPYADKVGLASALDAVSSTLEKAEGLTGGVQNAADAVVDDAKAKAAQVVDDVQNAAPASVQDGLNAAKNLLK